MKSLPVLCFILFSLISCKEQDSKKTEAEKQKENQEQKSVTPVTACILSEIAYCTDAEKQISQHMPGWKIVWNPAPVGGIYAFVASDGTNYAIAVRGSLIEFSWDAFDNWIYKDLNVASQESWPYANTSGAEISQGAYDGWQNMNKLVDTTSGKNLWQFLEANVKDENPVLVTGHSLGGNLATAFGSYLWFKYKEAGHVKNNISIITFAAPATGNKVFAEDFNSKFPGSLRIENSNDIVPKFPCSDKMATLGELYSSGPRASEISVGYKNATVKLNTVFDMLSLAQTVLDFKNSSYCQTNSEGKLITIKLSGKNNTNTIENWLAEAGYQHGIVQYATALDAPVIVCGQ